MSRSRFTLAGIARKPAAIQAQVAAELNKLLVNVPQVDMATYKEVQSIMKPKAFPKRRRIERTRNAGTQTEAAYWGSVRSCLRRAFRFWKPAQEALRRARVARSGKHNAKWAYLCCDCQKLFRRRGVQIDHLIPCGSLTSFEHVGEFLRRLTPESADDYAIRCTDCHQKKTTSERNP